MGAQAAARDLLLAKQAEIEATALLGQKGNDASATELLKARLENLASA